MSYPETTTMATASAFNLPTMAGLDFGNDDLADDKNKCGEAPLNCLTTVQRCFCFCRRTFNYGITR